MTSNQPAGAAPDFLEIELDEEVVELADSLAAKLHNTRDEAISWAIRTAVQIELAQLAPAERERIIKQFSLEADWDAPA